MVRETKTTKVTLLSFTQHPIETIYSEWMQSRTEGPILEPHVAAKKRELYRHRMEAGTQTEDDVRFELDVLSTFEKVIAMKIPIAETVDFVFMLEHCPIALREQIVRHRIGHRFAGRLGADIIPDLSESTFWSQTMRVLNLGTFASDGEYLLPESIQTVKCTCTREHLVGIRTTDKRWLSVTAYKNPVHVLYSFPNFDSLEKSNSLFSSLAQAQAFIDAHREELDKAARRDGEDHRVNAIAFPAEEIERRVVDNCKCNKTINVRGDKIKVEDFYHEQMGWIQSAYNRLIEAGVPVEDARNLLPLGCQHRLTWKMNLSALMHVLSKRGCWIAQLGMWEPVIRGIVEELATKIHPSFRKLIDPPCFGHDGKFNACVFKLENENRVKGDDPYAPCPLYLHHHRSEGYKIQNGAWRLEAGTWMAPSESKYVEFRVRGKQYEKLWGRNCETGQKLDVVA